MIVKKTYLKKPMVRTLLILLGILIALLLSLNSEALTGRLGLQAGEGELPAIDFEGAFSTSKDKVEAVVKTVRKIIHGVTLKIEWDV